MIRPWLMLARRRLIVGFLLALGFMLLMHMWVSAENVVDFGVFWHHFCGCPPKPADLRVLLNFPITSALIGLVFGCDVTLPTATMGTTPGVNGNSRFLLTRPVARITALLGPLAVATLALCIIPALATGLLIGWLRLVHAPSLGHLLAILQQLPAVHALGQHPSLADILVAVDYPRRYLGSIVVGLCAYSAMAAQRWLLLSTNRQLQILGAFVITVLWLPMLPLVSKRLGQVILMVPGPLDLAAPSPLAIALHCAFAAAVVFSCWRILRRVEI